MFQGTFYVFSIRYYVKNLKGFELSSNYKMIGSLPSALLAIYLVVTCLLLNTIQYVSVNNLVLYI